jgi:formate dehydrogenase iron-sulfur subunit
MSGKSFLIDTSKCTACRGCQVACKEWNMNPATVTHQTGTHQNPPDLSVDTYKLVRFSELTEDGKVKWYFFADQCRHCLTPPCKIMAETLGVKAISQDEKTGAVLYHPNVRVKQKDFEKIRGACPWNIPRWGPKTRGMAKCTMCIDRLSVDMLPACVKTCPTGAMSFGDRDEILEKAKKRLDELKPIYPKAELLNHEYVRTIFLVIDDPKKYYEFASTDGSTLFAEIERLSDQAVRIG